jgi:flagellar hook-associated protein 2
MGISPIAFTGLSKYSEDFQTILTRQTNIASLPLRSLQNQQTDLLAQKTLVGGIRSATVSLGDAVRALGQLGESKGLVASSSNSAKVTATNASATAPVSYNITEISSIARAASETSAVGFATSGATAVASTDTVQLQVGSETFSLDLTGRNNLEGLRNAINGLSNAGVTATVLNTGSATDPFYLSISANSPGAKTLRLVDDNGAGADLLTSANQGANTVFKLNGVEVSKQSTFINDVVPGVTFNILGTTSGSESVSVSLASDRTRLRSALQNFASAYNEVAGQLDSQIGPAAGLLSGDFLVRETQDTLRALTRYEGSSGSVRSLAALGIELDRQGRMTFNTETFDALSSSQVSAGFAFLGSPTTGFGALVAKVDGITDPVTGLAKLQTDRYDVTDSRLSNEIAEMSERINNMQRSLSARLQAADALLGQLQSQQSLVDASIQGLKFSLFGKSE